MWTGALTSRKMVTRPSYVATSTFPCPQRLVLAPAEQQSSPFRFRTLSWNGVNHPTGSSLALPPPAAGV